MTLKTQMEKIINKSCNNIGGIVVIKNGKTLYESYYKEGTAKSSIHVFSVTKSIISILIGIAIDKGYINSIHQNVLEFFPEYIVKKGETTLQQVTLKDLLTMTAPYKYKSEPYAEYFACDNWVNFALDLLGGKSAIGEFRYTPLIGPDILSGILIKSTGRNVLDFAAEYLFKPLGIQVDSNVVFHNKEEQLAWYKEKNSRGWVTDRCGNNAAGWGLSLTPMDMAKLGELYREGGTWEGRQIVSTKWIEESTKEQSRDCQHKLSYGYLWWIINDKEHTYAAMGDGGNIIYVNEKMDIVISIASFYAKHFVDRIKLIKEYIEPVFSKE